MRLATKLAALLLLGAAMTALPATAADEAAMSSGKVKYVSGGVGEDSDARMHSLGKEYNLKLLFAAKDGHYLADVALTIVNERGVKVLDTTAEGPWLFAALAPGKYRISATYAGTAVARDTTVPASGRREVFFRWVEPAESTTD